MVFVDRKKELEIIEDLFERDGAQFIVLYGRRRIGKTALLTQWQKLHSDSIVFWVAHQTSSDMLLKSFSQAVEQALPGGPSGSTFNDWEAALNYVVSLSRNRTLALVIDEFPYLLQSVPGVAGILQKVWDHRPADARLRLVLSGSHYHMMHEQFASGRGPLYGRSTADILLREIEPDQLALFLPRYSPAQIVETYGIVGGVPKYLEMWDDRKAVVANVRDLVLSPVTIFRQEALFLIQDEISEPRTYLAILESIGCGRKTPAAIAAQTGILPNHVGKYLNTLCSLGFIDRIVSVAAVDRGNSRQSRYEIRDAYLRFFFHFLYPNLTLLEQDRTARLLRIIEDQLPAFVGGTAFEQLARRAITVLGDSEKLSFVPEHVGRIWSRAVEVDIAAVSRRDRAAILGECKWTNRKMSERDLENLRVRTGRLPLTQDWSITYALFSRSGFTAALRRLADRDKVLLFEGPELHCCGT